ncbi:hypothetical protein EVAR_36261_1 [Eumeta japonica]|uniref:Uncharacterized protein n=1 Tax=Eumeta variegata TaxID=151549 RepID=A0A4C1WVS9_EUMVA|nr:hypothetical protein EVAR_36261_1 [Eumeta japonica]
MPHQTVLVLLNPKEKSHFGACVSRGPQANSPQTVLVAQTNLSKQSAAAAAAGGLSLIELKHRENINTVSHYRPVGCRTTGRRTLCHEIFLFDSRALTLNCARWLSEGRGLLTCVVANATTISGIDLTNNPRWS